MEGHPRALPVRPLAGAVLAVASGAAYALAFPPFEVQTAAWWALAPLFVAATSLPPGRAAAIGLVWALNATLGVVAWLPDTLVRTFHVSVPLARAALAGIALVSVGG